MVLTMITTLSIISLGVYLIYYKSKSGKPKLFCKDNSSFKNHILATCPILSARYFPTWWAPSGHGTTIARHFFQKRLHLDYKQEELFTGDGRNFIVDWYPDTVDRGNEFILIIIPGITANSKVPYTEYLCASVAQLNLQVVVCNHRGSRGEKIIGDKINSACEIQPLIALLKCIEERYPSSKVIAVGVSLGGMILTRYLADMGPESKISYALSICMPWDCFQTQINLEKSFISKSLYNRKLSSNLRKFTRINFELISRVTGITEEDVAGMNLISDFDAKVIVPMYGYRSLRDYYSDASSTGKVDSIAIPYISLNTRDDPFVPWRSIPILEFERNSNAMLVLTEAGGHVGFVEGTVPKKTFYLSRLLPQILESFMVLSRN